MRVFYVIAMKILNVNNLTLTPKQTDFGVQKTALSPIGKNFDSFTFNGRSAIYRKVPEDTLKIIAQTVDLIKAKGDGRKMAKFFPDGRILIAEILPDNTFVMTDTFKSVEKRLEKPDSIIVVKNSKYKIMFQDVGKKPRNIDFEKILISPNPDDEEFFRAMAINTLDMELRQHFLKLRWQYPKT